MAKVAVCFSSGGTVNSSFAVCVAALIATTAAQGVQLTIINAESSLNMVNRDYAVKEAKKQGCTHVFFLDSDMVFPADSLLKLLDGDKPIIGTLYSRRVYPYATLGYLLDESETGIAKAGEMGLGCILIHLSVFDEMKAPYFRCPAVESIEEVSEELKGFDLSGINSGDTIDDSIWFSKAARRAGHDLWVDVQLTFEVGHTGFTTHYIPRKVAT